MFAASWRYSQGISLESTAGYLEGRRLSPELARFAGVDELVGSIRFAAHKDWLCPVGVRYDKVKAYEMKRSGLPTFGNLHFENGEKKQTYSVHCLDKSQGLFSTLLHFLVFNNICAQAFGSDKIPRLKVPWEAYLMSRSGEWTFKNPYKELKQDDIGLYLMREIFIAEDRIIGLSIGLREGESIDNMPRWADRRIRKKVAEYAPVIDAIAYAPKDDQEKMTVFLNALQVIDDIRSSGTSQGIEDKVRDNISQ